MKKKMLFLTALLLSFCSLESWAYVTRCYVKAGNSAMGLVYVNSNGGEPAENKWKEMELWDGDYVDDPYEGTFYIYAKAEEGYQFVGWDVLQYVNSIDDAHKAVTSIKTSSYNVANEFYPAVLKANFAPYKYDIYFTREPGEEYLRVYEDVEYGETIPVPECSKEGKTFRGWKNWDFGQYYEPSITTLDATMANAGNSINMLALWDEPTTVKLNKSGYATYSSDVDLTVKTEGVKAYTGETYGETIYLNEVQGRIPAGTGIILYGKPNQIVEFNYATEAVKEAAIVQTTLYPTTFANGDLANLDDFKQSNYKFYALGPNAEFLEYTGERFTPNRAYFHLAESYAKSLKIVFNDATAIAPIATEKQQTATRKFIENGKLVIEKNGVKYNVMGIKK